MEQSISTPQVGASPSAGRVGAAIIESLSAMTDRIRRRLAYGLATMRHPFTARFSSNLSIDRIADRLAVEARGSQDGARERPSTIQEELAGTENEIVHYCRELQCKADRRVSKMGERLRARGQAIDLDATARYLRDLPHRCRNQILRAISNSRAELQFLQEREHQQRAHYETFQEQNKLTRIARYPDFPALLGVFVIALIPAGSYALGAVGLAGFENDSIFPGSLALAMSALGVLVPFLVGAGYFRGINHVQAAERFAAWFAGYLTLAFVVVLAYVSANFAVQLGIDPASTLDDVLARILADPLAAKSDIAAWQCAGIVGFIALLAFVVGYRIDDPYPGYGSVQRAYYRARGQHENRTRVLQRRLNAIVDAAERDVRARTKREKSRIRRFSNLVEKSRRMHTDLAGFDSALEDTCNILLDRYRAANESARRTEVPLSFSEHVCFRADSDSSAEILRHGEGRLDILDREFAEFESEADQVRQKLRDLNQRGILDVESRIFSGDDI